MEGKEYNKRRELVINRCVKDKDIKRSPHGEPLPKKYHLNDERLGKTIRFEICTNNGTIHGYFTVGCYTDGTPGELFIWVGKQGEETHGWVNSLGKAISWLLQLGVNPEKIYEEFKLDEFEPKGITNVKESPICKSIIDMIMKYMEANFPPTVSEVKDDDDGYFSMTEAIVDCEDK